MRKPGRKGIMRGEKGWRKMAFWREIAMAAGEMARSAVDSAPFSSLGSGKAFGALRSSSRAAWRAGGTASAKQANISSVEG